jgi:hypothetical protein
MPDGLTEHYVKRMACPAHGDWNLGELHKSPDPSDAAPVLRPCPVEDCGRESRMRSQTRAWNARPLPYHDVAVPDYASTYHMLGVQMRKGVGNRKAKGRPKGSTRKPDTWNQNATNEDTDAIAGADDQTISC